MAQPDNGTVTSFENILLKNKNVASHPQLAGMLDDYTAAVAGGYTPPPAVIDSLLQLAPKSPSAQARLDALKTQLHVSGFINDQPTLTIADAAGALTEGDGAATLTDSGALSVVDRDAIDIVTVSHTYNNDLVWSDGAIGAELAAALVAGFSVDHDSWDYATSQNLDFLGNNQTIVFSYNVVATDNSGAANGASAPQTVTVAITGTNDSPVAIANDNGGDAVTEAGVNPDDTPFPGDPLATGNVLTNDTDADAGDVITVQGVAAGSLSEPLNTGVGETIRGIYGTLTLAADGAWTYALDNSDPDTDALTQDEAAQDAFTYTVRDAAGATSSAALTIDIAGTDDRPVAPGPLDLDVFVLGHLGSSNVVLVNQGRDQGGVEGQFATVSAGVADAYYNNDVALGDFDRDGDLDAMVVRANWLSGDNVLLINQGDAQGGTEGNFVAYPAPGSSAESSNTWHFALGDLNGDGSLDAYLATWQGTADQILFNEGPSGTGVTFSTAAISGTGAAGSSDVALGDLDRDGDLDAFVSNWGAGPNQVVINQGFVQGGTEGVFIATAADPSETASESTRVALGDTDGDGDLDALATNWGITSPQVYVNQGGDQNGTEGAFVAQTVSATTSDSRAMALADLDGDGDLDGFVANWSTVPNQFLWNQGGAQNGTEGVFIAENAPGTANQVVDVAVGDIDSDGDLDILLAGDTGTNEILVNGGGLQGGTEGAFTLGGTFAGVYCALALGDMDGDGATPAVGANGLPNHDGLLLI
jgi:VCBS repeat-containing protein